MSAARITALLARESPLTWVFGGDSVTQGAAHTFGHRDYTELVRERIGWELGRSTDVFVNAGVSGWTVADLVPQLDFRVRRFDPDVVFLMFGLNDAAKHPGNVRRFTDGYATILDALGDDVTVVLQSPNTALPGDVATPEAVAELADAVRTIAADRGLLLVDHHREWTALTDRGPLEQWIGWGCHPNEYGHRVLARRLLTELGVWDPLSPSGRLLIP
jgi:acyl-CoA thioesterase I